MEYRTPKIFESEKKFMNILWEYEPVTSAELVALSEEKLDWKKSTTYTVIRRLAERGILVNRNTIVTSLFSKEEVEQSESEEFLEKNFQGSLPVFLTAFTKKKKLTEKEIEEIRNIIDSMEE